MRTRHLLSFLSFLFFLQCVQAQQMKPASLVLQARLQKYVSDNHLPLSGTYIYFDTISKKPYRFQPKDYMVQDMLEPQVQNTASSFKETTDNVTGISNFHLIKDLNTSTDAVFFPSNADFNNTHFVTLNGVAYFTANDGIHGNELWRSDGTAAGTYLVKDVFPGEAGASPGSMATSGNLIYFTVQTSAVNSNTFQLWKTDGTETGTALVKTFLSSEGFTGNPVNLCDVNGVLYFSISNKNFLNQLWKTDGTTAGTVLVNDYATSGVIFLRDFVAMDGVLYFVAGDDTHGSELWRYDGTVVGSYRVTDIDPSTSYYSDGPRHITAYNHKLYFSESDNNSLDQKLWISDGTPAGTSAANTNNSQIVLPQLLGYSDPFANQPYTISNGILYFSARQYLFYGNGDYGKVDGLYSFNTADPSAGIQEVIGLAAFSSSYYETGIIIDENDIIAVNNSIYFAYNDTAHTYLYKTNGTEATTVLLKRFDNYYGIPYLAGVNGRVYFSAVTDLAYYGEPWVSDGTEAGTVLLKDIYPGAVGSQPQYFTAVNNKMLFGATDDAHGNELWQTDGTTTQLVKDVNQTTTSNSIAFSFNKVSAPPFKDGILARLETFDKGGELYTATAGDETLVKDIYAGQLSGSPFEITVKNNLAYFVGTVPDAGMKTNGITITSNGVVVNEALFKTDGTKEGTVQITPTISSSMGDFTVADDGSVYYVLSLGIRDEIWKSDGTVAGNTLIYPSPSRNSFFISSDFDASTFTSHVFTQVGSTFYFAAYNADPNTGTELWKTDGTTAGTVLVKDINPGNGNADITHITAFNGQVYFSAYDGTETALWKSDGTEAGTMKVKSVQPNAFTISGNTLFFSGFDATYGNELWKTDGTTAGTVLVKDISTGANSSSPQYLTDVNGTLFFEAFDSASNVQLWKSDGTKAGTVLVKNIAASSDGISLGSFISAANQLYFLAGNKLWVSNGTDEGTGQVTDDALSNLVISSMSVNGNHLFLNAYNYRYGYELYEGDAASVALPVTLTAFTASLKNSDVATQWQTASEINTSYFNLQRSTDGVHFSTIGKTAAKGNGTYAFTDINIANLVSANTVYYRLQIVDKDGSATFSSVVPVSLNLKDAVVLLLPNPVKDVLRVRVNNYTGKAAISVFDANGKVIYTTQQAVQSGGDVTINASSLQSGVYMVKVTLGTKTIQQKFVKE